MFDGAGFPRADREDRPARPTHRLFFGVLVEASARGPASRISHLHDLDRGLRGSRLLPERYHVTLQGFGDYFSRPDHVIDLALRIGARVRMRQFEARFTYAESFRGRQGHHPYVLRGDEGVAGFQQLRMAIGGAMLGEGMEVSDHSFTPHLTLQYGKRCVGPLNIQPISWKVRDFALILSHLGQTRYEILGQWPLESEVIEAGA